MRQKKNIYKWETYSIPIRIQIQTRMNIHCMADRGIGVQNFFTLIYLHNLVYIIYVQCRLWLLWSFFCNITSYNLTIFAWVKFLYFWGHVLHIYILMIYKDYRLIIHITHVQNWIAWIFGYNTYTSQILLKNIMQFLRLIDFHADIWQFVKCFVYHVRSSAIIQFFFDNMKFYELLCTVLVRIRQQ